MPTCASKTKDNGSGENVENASANVDYYFRKVKKIANVDYYFRKS